MTSEAIRLAATILEEGGYATEVRRSAPFDDFLLAETDQAVVGCFECSWATLRDRLEDAQAFLTELAAEHPSPRSWDLYLAALLRTPADEAQELLREHYEHDTRYARKFVIAGALDGDSIDRALRPLLPLRTVTSPPLVDPVDALRAELDRLGVDPDVSSTALASYSERGKVELP